MPRTAKAGNGSNGITSGGVLENMDNRKRQSVVPVPRKTTNTVNIHIKA